jgi:DNA polymerase III sliding clamp (beta) subunit (PCNA family)
MNKQLLLKALETVKPALANRENFEQATSFAFIGNKVITYNDEISISQEVEGLDLTGAVSAKELYQLLGKLKQEEIDLIATENELLIKGGKVKAGISFNSKVKLPIESIDKIGKWKLLPEDFTEALEIAVNCCSNDLSRLILTCVHVNGNIIEASDSVKLYKHTLKKEVQTNKFLLPANSAKELIKMRVTHIAEGKGAWIHFKSENAMISCRILEENYPDSEKYFKKIDGAQFTFPKGLNNTLDKITIFSDLVKIDCDNKIMTISSFNDGGNSIGWVKERFKSLHKGEPITFGINVNLLKLILNKNQTCLINKDFLLFTGDNWKYLACLYLIS